MIEVSEAFKDAMKAPVKTLQAAITVQGTENVYTSSDVLQKFEIEQSGYFFGVATKVLSFTLIGTEYDLVEKNLLVELQVLADSVWETCDYGKYLVREQTTDLEKGVTTVKAYDSIALAALTPYQEGEITFPCTVKQLVAEIANKFGMVYSVENDLPNGDYVIPEDLYAKISGITYRDILAEFAGATATLPRTNSLNNTLTVAMPGFQSQETLTYSNLRKVKVEPKYGPVDSVVLARTPAEDNIAVVDEAMRNAAGGKNLFDKDNANITTCYASSSTNKMTSPGAFKNIYIPCEPNTTYTVSRAVVGTNPRFCVFTTANPPLNNEPVLNSVGVRQGDDTALAHTITTPNNAHYLGVYVVKNNATTPSFEEIIETYQIEKGSSASSYEPFKPNGLTELKLANNEILDDNREEMITPILNAIDGFEFCPFEATTEGHGWYECGDRLTIANDTNSWDVVITDIKLTIDGSLKEVIKGIAPDETQTNYALAGGITKTVYNTEIKVDKQGQTIESIVEEQITLENQVNENFTTVTQTISDVVTSVQNSGGNNLLKNSAMYSLDSDGLPISWALSGNGTITIAPSAESAVNGSLSRQNITLKNKTATQVVDVKADNSSIVDKTYYSFSCKIKKTAPGECLIRITDGTENGVWDIALNNGDEAFYKEYSLEGILPNSPSLTVSVYGSNDSEFSINDMMLAVGDYKSQWTQANGEFANTQVAIDSNGVTVRSSSLNGTYTKQTPQELSAFQNNTMVATINDDGIAAPKAEFTEGISMPPIKLVPQNNGWAFVRSDS
ncbi:hypothetical protein IKD67_01820 [Candidatus Saccharibacteria bacterium]|nr:hypothetical protein [Candidatus Saccharibacteria bacterium]